MPTGWMQSSFINKRNREFELGTTENKFSYRSGRDLNLQVQRSNRSATQRPQTL